MKKTNKIALIVLGLLVLAGVTLSLDVAGSLFAQDAEEVEPLTPDAGEDGTEPDGSAAIPLFVPPIIPRAILMEVLGEAVVDGTIDQAQADALSAAIDEKMETTHLFPGGRGPFPWGGRPGLELHPAPGVFHALHQAVVEGVLTIESLRTIVVDMANTLGIAIDPADIGLDGRLHLPLVGLELTADDLLAALETALDKAVSAGDLTADAAAAILGTARNFEPLGTPPFGPFHRPGGLDGPRGPQGWGRQG